MVGRDLVNTFSLRKRRCVCKHYGDAINEVMAPTDVLHQLGK